MSDEKVPITQIAVKLQQAMDAEGVSIRQMAEEFDLTYEYFRRLLKGMTVPSKPVMRLICQRFNWDWPELERMMVQDKFRQRNGQSGAIAQDINPEVEPFERSWHLLEQSQKDLLVSQLNQFLAQNRRHVRGGLKPQVN